MFPFIRVQDWGTRWNTKRYWLWKRYSCRVTLPFATFWELIDESMRMLIVRHSCCRNDSLSPNSALLKQVTINTKHYILYIYVRRVIFLWLLNIKNYSPKIFFFAISRNLYIVVRHDYDFRLSRVSCFYPQLIVVASIFFIKLHSILWIRINSTFTPDY